MQLSPEERRRVYEEEKARIAAEEKTERERPGAERVQTVNLDPNLAGLLCYLGWWITGVVFLVLEQKRPSVRFHAIQSIIVFGVLFLATAMLSPIPFVGWFFGALLGTMSFVLWIVLMLKAYNGVLFKVPLAGDVAEKASGVLDRK